jgi:large subunit ribosomal protein L25
MAQQRTKLKVSPREDFGSRATRRLRRDGIVPGIVYGQGGDARPFQVPARELRTVLLEGQTLLDLELDGSGAVPVVIKEQQNHPVRGDVMHLDCLEVRLDEEIQAEVAIELEGTDQAPGVREGGVLEHVTREITVEALPTEIPEQITVDVSEMNINDTINLDTVTIPSGVKLMVDEPSEVTIATLSPPRVEEEPEVEEETELIGEDGEPIEPEEGAEGEEGEGEGEAPAEGGDEGGGGEDSGGDEGLWLGGAVAAATAMSASLAVARTS